MTTPSQPTPVGPLPSFARLPAWLVLGLAVFGGVGSAVQTAANAELGSRVGTPSIGAVVNNIGLILVALVGVLAMPSIRAGFTALRRARLPWWSHLGGLGGGVFVLAATYAVPVLGVAVFTIAQVAGNGVGGLGVDRAGLGPVGRLGLTRPRVAGALLGIGAVALAQLGRPVGDLAVGMLLLGVAAGVALALQAALTGRLSTVSGMPAGAVVNFAVSTPTVLVVAAVLGAFAGLGRIDWPAEWYLYVGGLFGVGIMAVVLIGVRSVGVLRTGLAMVAGQLGGALLLDVVRPGGPGLSLTLLVGVLLTLLALVTSGRGARSGPKPG